MRRVLIIGSGGAGKSTIATQLRANRALPVIHLDAHYWHPGGVATRPDVWLTMVAELTARDAWVMDGNYGGTTEQRLVACGTVLFWICLASCASGASRDERFSMPVARDRT